MLEARGIRRGIEVLVADVFNTDLPSKKAIVIRTYPKPSSWMVVKYENGDMEQVDETRVTTMFEVHRDNYIGIRNLIF